MSTELELIPNEGLELIPTSALAPIKELKLEDRIGLDKKAMAKRDTLLADAKKTVPQLITVPAEQVDARDQAVKLKTWLKTAEENMDDINAILLPLQRKARRLADEAQEPVKKLLGEIELKLTGFRLREEERVQREEEARKQKIREAQAETDRLNREAAERARKLEADKANAARLQREADELAAKAKTAKEKKAAAKAQEEAAEATVTQEELEEAAAAELEAAEAAERERAVIITKPAEVSTAKGLVGGRRKKWELEADPEAIHRLYAHNRNLVRMEPNAAGILSTCQPEIPTPGIKVWWESKTDIRS